MSEELSPIENPEEFQKIKKEVQEITPQIEGGFDIAELERKRAKREAQEKEEIEKIREELGLKDESLENLRPELQEAISKIPKVGEPLLFGQYEEIVAHSNKTGEVWKKEKQGLLPDQDISWENLCFVKAGNFLPKIEQGALKIPTAYEATKDTDNEAVRLTTHWTTNHIVQSHEFGNWKESPYLIIVPGEGMKEKNGNPLNLYAIDTFWNKSISLPENTIVLYKAGSKKPEVPEELQDQILSLEVKNDQELEECFSIILKKMGYTRVEGGRTYSRTENFDQLITKLAEKEDIKFHTGHIQVKTMETLFERYFHPHPFLGGGAGDLLALTNYYSEIPEKLKNKLINTLEKNYLADDLNFETRKKVYSTLDNILYNWKYEGIPRERVEDLVKSISKETWLKHLNEYGQYLIKKGEVTKEEYLQDIKEAFRNILGEDADLEWLKYKESLK